MRSFPCLIKQSEEGFNSTKITEYIEENLNKSKNNDLFVEIRNEPYTEFFDDDFKFKRTSYKNYLEEIIVESKMRTSYYFINEININNIIKNGLNNIRNNFLNNNKILSHMKLREIGFSRADDFVIISGHMETTDNFICATEGELDILLINPMQKKYVYPYDGKHGPINYSRVNFFSGKNIDDKFPEFYKADRVYISLLEKECLYIPSFWWRSIKTSSNEEKSKIVKFITLQYESSSRYLDRLFN